MTKVKIVTPVGELNFCNITGKGKENYNGDGQVFTATVNLTGQDAANLIKQIDDLLGVVPANKHIKSKGYRELLKDAEGVFAPSSRNTERQKGAEKTGIFAFQFSTKTTFTDEKGNVKDKVIKVYNSTNPPTVISLGNRLIGNGSKGAISGLAQVYEQGKGNNIEVGVSLFLNAVQLVKFIPYEGDAGFGGVEGGYTGDDDGAFDDTPTASEEASVPATTAATPKL